MMHEPTYKLTVILVAIIGIALIGKGLTGMVISESCCFPPNCSEERMCDAAQPYLESPKGTLDTNMLLFGITFIAVAWTGYTWFRNKP
jgi:hypothetical protein